MDKVDFLNQNGCRTRSAIKSNWQERDKQADRGNRQRNGQRNGQTETEKQL